MDEMTKDVEEGYGRRILTNDCWLKGVSECPVARALYGAAKSSHSGASRALSAFPARCERGAAAHVNGECEARRVPGANDA